jgi:hypothetical protein
LAAFSSAAFLANSSAFFLSSMAFLAAASSDFFLSSTALASASVFSSFALVS